MKRKKFPIDLSMLTEEEIDQFREDSTTLYEGAVDVALYLRFSSERQKEQSIEGQLRDCIAYCKRKGYRIDRDQIIFWLTKFKDGDIEDEEFRRHIIDLMVNSVTVWDEPDGYRITTAYNLTSCKTKTFQATSNSDPSCGEGFGFGTPESTIGRISEPYIVWGTVFVQTKRHSLP